MSGQHYCLRWNNYQSNMTSVFHQLLQNEAFVDVTLACNDLSLKAHKVVLSACSSYFQKLLLENPCKHPTIIMPQDVCYEDLKFIIEFVYKGEIDVSQAELQSLLRTADQLKIKGLCESPDDKENSDSPPPIYGKGAAVDANNPSAVDAAAAAVAASQPPTPAAAAAEPETLERYKKDIAIEKAIPSEPDLFSHRDGGNPKAPKYPRVSSEPGSDERVPEIGTCSTNAAVATTTTTINNNNNSQNDKEGPNNHHHQYHQQQQQRRSSSSSSSSGEENDDMPVALDERKRKRAAAQQPQQQHTPPEQTKPLNMSSHGILAAGQTIFSQFGVDTDDFPPEPPAPSAIPVGHVDMSEHHSPTRTLLVSNAATTLQRTDLSDSTKFSPSATSTTAAASDVKKEADIKFETLRSYDQDSLLDMESHMSGRGDSMDSQGDGGQQGGMQMMQQDFSGMMAGVSNRIVCIPDVNSGDDLVPGMKNNGHSDMHIPKSHGGGPKTWTQEDMDMALDALRNHNMSLTKASATYGIPSTTLWQRAHRLGIDTPKKEGPTKSWTEENLNSALDALRTGTISANKASKAYGIPSSTLYKIARREGIRLAAPFNAAPTTWTPEDLEKALESIRTGQTSVQKASTEFGIPTGTLYGRCKREGIELSRSNPTPWSEDAMGEALEAVRLGHMSINQAAIHYNLPYSSLYGRFKRGIKYETDNLELNQDSQSQMDTHSFTMEYSTSHQQIQYQNQNS